MLEQAWQNNNSLLTGGPYPLAPLSITSGAMYCIVPEIIGITVERRRTFHGQKCKQTNCFGVLLLPLITPYVYY